MISRHLFAMTTFVQPFLRQLRRACGDRNGQTLVEYALILAVITIVLVTVFSLLSARIIVVFSAITTILDTAQASLAIVAVASQSKRLATSHLVANHCSPRSRASLQTNTALRRTWCLPST